MQKTGNLSLTENQFVLNAVPKALFSSIPLTTGLTNTVAVKTLGWLGGIAGFTVPSINGYILLFLSSFLIVSVGSLFVDILGIKAKDEWGKLLYVLLIGTALWYIVMVGITWIGFMPLIGLLIFYGLTAYAGLFLAKLLKAKVD